MFIVRRYSPFIDYDILTRCLYKITSLKMYNFAPLYFIWIEYLLNYNKSQNNATLLPEQSRRIVRYMTIYLFSYKMSPHLVPCCHACNQDISKNIEGGALLSTSLKKKFYFPSGLFFYIYLFPSTVK